MKNILYLVHRIPYPPNKGDKIRSYNILKYLSKNNNIYLATFIDYQEDEQYETTVQNYCVESIFVRLVPLVAKFKSLLSLVEGQPLSIVYYRNNKIKAWIKNLLKKNRIDYVFIFSSSMTQFALIDELKQVPKIIDFVDMDSGKWQQYSKSKSWPLSYIYKREAKTLHKLECEYAKSSDASFFVSQSEVDLFLQSDSKLKDKVIAVQNGVDFEYFDSEIILANPYSTNQVICFTGAMDYWANVDAVTWFVREVFAVISQKHPNCRFFIVGSNPTKSVIELSEHQGVYVTGAVEDVRPYIQHATLVVAPIRIAQGIQNKVLEAMAMAKPIVLSPQAMEGIDGCSRLRDQVADSNSSFARKVTEILDNDTDISMGETFRDYVRAKFSWDASLQKIDEILSN